MNKKIAKISIIIAIVTSIVIAIGIFSYKSLATATNEMLSEGIGDPPEFPYITLNDLYEMFNILCCQKGTNLPSYKSTIVTQGDKQSSEPYLTQNDIGKKLFEEKKSVSGYSTDTNFDNPYTVANSLTYGYYTKSEEKTCSPAEAYILAEMSENTYGNASDFYNITNQEYTGEVTEEITLTVEGVTLYGVDIKGDEGEEREAGAFVTKGEDGKYYYVEFSIEGDYFPYTYVQYAWWTTKAGGSTVVKSTSLQKEAEAFEAYLKKVAKKDSNGNIVTEKKKVTINGKTVTLDAPVIDFKVTGNSKNAKAYYDEEEKKYLIGPFDVTYYEESVKSERGTIIFSEMTNAVVKSNLGIVPREEWEFVFPDRDDTDKAAYPHTGETFYITVNYIDGMTQIEDINLSFRYMNAAGKYIKLKGEYFKATWEPKDEAIWCEEETSYCECGGTSEVPHRAQYDKDGKFIGYACSGGAKKCSHGYYHKHIVEWHYWLELTDLDPKESQTLAEGLIGARWYETADVSLLGIDLPHDDDEEPKTVIKLTIQIAGEVWIDTEPDKKKDTIDGIKEDGEKPYEKAEVYVYQVYFNKQGKEVKRELASMYEADNVTKKNFPVYTDKNGKYEIANISVPGTDKVQDKGYTLKYDVIFKYDGQNYRPTDFLVTGDGDANKYMSENKDGRKKYEKDSMAIEDESERDSFNKKFTEVYGNTPMDDNGNTNGRSKDGNKSYSLDYTSEEYKISDNDNSRRISTLTTKDKNGYTLPLYKMSASTGKAGLYFPFAREISLDTADDVKLISIKETKWLKTITYRTIYDYMLHINLGLKERDEADLAVGKDLYKAEVVVNEKELTYKYNTLYDFEDEKNQDLLKTQIEAADTKPYTLGLYSSDYAYRSTVYSRSEEVVKSIKANTELRVFLTYKVVAYNESEGYLEAINVLNDYYDKSFTPIEKDLVANVLNKQGVRETKRIAEQTYYRIVPSMEVAPYKYNRDEDTANYTTGSVTWNKENNFNKSNSYKKMNTNSLKNLKLKAGERIEIFVTFEVDKEGFLNKSQTNRNNLLGEKNNIAEIANYSTYYTDGKVAGRIDKDSAPDNIDFKKNVKKWYEDDTESAPAIDIELYNYDREINGIVWEDKETNTLKYNQKVANGTYDSSNENGIDGLDVELIEKISIDNIEYEYLWPADAFKGTVAEKGFNSTDVTSKGKYSLGGFVAGNYVVRFKYGNNEASIKYNGQDYKNTAYQTGMVNKEDNTSTLNNEWHDLTDEKLRSARVSDARDYELQRMKVVAYSRKINNPIGTVLETADNKSVKHDELIKNTQMVANTAKLNLEIERQDYIDYGTKQTVDGITEYTYVVGNIDFGLEKRSETAFELKKNLTTITLYKQNGTQQVMKVVIGDDGKINIQESQELEKLTRVEKTPTAQGFSYINMETDYLRDLKIVLEYKITVENKSEVDWTGLLAEYTDTATASKDIEEEVKKLEKQAPYVSGIGIEYGNYVGLNYYNNKNNDSDKLVTTKVESIIDYIDNNTSIDPSSVNSSKDQSWKVITTQELINNKSLGEKVYTTENGKTVIADKDGGMYDTETRKNIYITDTEAHNPSIIAELVPEAAKDSGKKYSGQIKLVTSKTTTSDESIENMIYDNVSEILVYSNTVGRRDPQAVPGNAEVSRGEFTAATGYSITDGSVVTDYTGAKEQKVNSTEYHLNGERDTDAAEFVTFTEPTGYTGNSIFKSNAEYLVAIGIGCVILAIGIAVIKVKVVDVDIKKNKKQK